MSAEPLVVVGDALLDRDIEGRVERLAPDAPVPVVDEETTRARAGGAGLAASLAAAGDRDVTLVTALAEDEAGAELAALLAEAGVEVVELEFAGATPEKIRVRSDGRSLLRVDRGSGRHAGVGRLTAAARAAIGWASAILVSDYGRGVAAEPGVREALESRSPRVPLVWDPHPRGPEPVGSCLLVTPNEAETRQFAAGVDGDGAGGTAARARALLEAWAAGGVCVTRGAAGAVLVLGDGAPRAFPAPPIAGGDVCGAGDRFASAVALLLADGASAADAVAGAVAEASAFVAAGGAGAVGGRPRQAPIRTRQDAEAVVARTRAAGGVVAATGGCFDLLHVGHIETLRAARSLGDCLVVCVNSDESVRQLKGPSRPLVNERDRCAVLAALECVDAVAVFGEDTPEAILERLRPDVWVKGGDYVARDLPEARVLERWGGRALVVPYREGRSTSRIIEEMQLGAV